MKTPPLRLLGLAAATSLLLDLPFPIAGPLPMWRTAFAWIALVPLLIGLLNLPAQYSERGRGWRLRWAFLCGWSCGALWFGVSDYWVYNTMHLYGGMNEAMAALCLVLFSLYLGVWFGLFALLLVVVREGTHATRFAWMGFAAVPLLWVGMELAIARVPEFPWDQLGASQVDNWLLTRLAPWTGVYGISFVLAGVNTLFVAGRIVKRKVKVRRGATLSVPTYCLTLGLILAAACSEGLFLKATRPRGEAVAVMLQPNLSVDSDNAWNEEQWSAWMGRWQAMVTGACKPSIAGMPGTTRMTAIRDCNALKGALVVWPESPAPFRDREPRFQSSMAMLAHDGPLIVGDVGMTPDADGQRVHYFNSASVFAQGGRTVGRYDKVHLVPFGEYVPFRQLFFFVKQLTDQLSDMGSGTGRQTFAIADAKGQTHRYGIFICYESVFADEVREFAENGAEVLVNISDDGWYGDSSAPWQHLNMARMRAIENRRWILRDTNNGVTTVIDPYGVVRHSIARHSVDTLAARYGFNSERTFYTDHGDWFAYACEILGLVLVLWAGRRMLYVPREVRA